MYLVKQNIISKEDQEICDYGVFVILFNGITMITTLILGSLMISFHFALYFLLFYLPLRMLLGGGHCQTPQKCFIFTHVDLIILFSLALFLPLNILNIISICLISIAVICYISSNKHKIYKIVLFIFFIFDLFIFINFIDLKLSMSCAYLLSSYLYFSDKLLLKTK